jgi:D-alanyl-D-alanine carboxypeptidase
MRLLLLFTVACGAARPATPDPLAADLDQLVARSSFSGALLVGHGEQLRYRRSTNPSIAPNARWRWASVTKQMTAILVMQEVARGTIDLQAPIATYLPTFASANATATIEQLLHHQAGLPNPDDGGDGVPAAYRPETAIDPFASCAGAVTGPPGGRWTYNNCDYVVAGAVLEAVTGKPWSRLFEERIAAPLGIAAKLDRSADVVGYVGGTREPTYAYERFGAAGALVGTVTELWTIDRALLEGRLLDDKHRAMLWDGKPDLGFMALGQWVYEVPLRGCAKPVRLVERRGAIGGIGVRNFLVPAHDLVVIAMTDRAELEFGELWSGAGFAFELLSIAVCTKSPHS